MLSVLVSCTHETTISIPDNEPLMLFNYAGASNKLSAKEVVLVKDKQQKLNTWISNNRTGWTPTPATYVPGVLVSGKGFGINFLGNSVIISYSEGQYVKSISPSDYQFLIE